MDYFEAASESLRSMIMGVLIELDKAVEQEAAMAFRTIIARYPTLSIYSLGLYYDAGAWAYLFPTFASEQGLAHVAKSHAFHSPASPEQEQIALRWSPCDSPHHNDGQLEDAMPETQAALEDLGQLLEAADPRLELIEWPADFAKDRNSFHGFLANVHLMARAAVGSALRRVYAAPDLNDFFQSTGCALTLNAGDISNEEFLENLRALNSAQTFARVAQEVAAADAMHELVHRLWVQKQEADRVNPPTTSLTPDDFSDLIEGFEPVFVEAEGAVYLGHVPPVGFAGTSESEALANRIRLMAFLEASPHYEELDRLFGHFIGNQFKPDDLLPVISRALVQKLGRRLMAAFPDRTFRVYMIVDRNALYHISFVSQRDDGFEFLLVPEMLEHGVQEIHEFGADRIGAASA